MVLPREGLFLSKAGSHSEVGSDWLQWTLLGAASAWLLRLPANWAAEQPNDDLRGAGFVHNAGCRSDGQHLGSVTEQGQSPDQQHRKVL